MQCWDKRHLFMLKKKNNNSNYTDTAKLFPSGDSVKCIHIPNTFRIVWISFVAFEILLARWLFSIAFAIIDVTSQKDIGTHCWGEKENTTGTNRDVKNKLVTVYPEIHRDTKRHFCFYNWQIPNGNWRIFWIQDNNRLIKKIHCVKQISTNFTLFIVYMKMNWTFNPMTWSFSGEKPQMMTHFFFQWIRLSNW